MKVAVEIEGVAKVAKETVYDLKASATTAPVLSLTVQEKKTSSAWIEAKA